MSRSRWSYELSLAWARRERDEARAENVDLRRRLRLARKIVEPLIDYEIGEGSRGEHCDPLRKVLPLLDLRKRLPGKGSRS